MFMRLTNAVAVLGAAVALSGALGLSVPGAALAASPSAPVSPTTGAIPVSPAATLPSGQSTAGPVAAPAIELAGCHREWHAASWYWFDRGGWDRWHHWQHRWEHRQHPGWWDCR